MKKTKKYILFSLAASIALSPMAVNAAANTSKEEIVPISAPAPEEDVVDKADLNDNVDDIDEVEVPAYIEYKGEIVTINKNENNGLISILVKDNKEEEFNGILFHINEDVILVNDKTKEFITREDLEIGMTVTGYYRKDTIMLMSLPPQLGPDAIVVNESEEDSSILVSKFDENLLSSDGSLVINISEDTLIVDKDGNELEKEDIKNEDLMIFYTAVMESYPAQTAPEKVILIDREDDMVLEHVIKVFDKVIINEKEIALDNNLYKNEEDVVMIPLRQISEALGYEIKWDNAAQSAELTKGSQWTAITIGKDNYNFARMLIKLGTAPEIKNSTTYVPFDFLKEVLRVDVEITEEGIITIQ